MSARLLTSATLAALALVPLACGSSTGSGSGSNPSSGGSVAGTVAEGPVAGATVTAYAITGGAMGAELGHSTTDASGSFTVPIGSYSGPMMLRAAGGTYTDEATGSSMPMADGDVMTTAMSSVAASAATTGVQVTPLTSMAQAMANGMAGGMTAGNIDSANAGVGSYFSVGDIVHTMPMDPTVAGSGSGATPDARNYGLCLAAMSEYAKTVGMSSSSGMVTAMMDDAADGVMNGMMGSSQVSMPGMGGMMGGSGGMMSATAGTAGLGSAMTTFIGSPMNRSGVGLADMQSLVDQLMHSNGHL